MYFGISKIIYINARVFITLRGYRGHGRLEKSLSYNVEFILSHFFFESCPKVGFCGWGSIVLTLDRYTLRGTAWGNALSEWHFVWISATQPIEFTYRWLLIRDLLKKWKCRMGLYCQAFEEKPQKIVLDQILLDSHFVGCLPRWWFENFQIDVI